MFVVSPAAPRTPPRPRVVAGVCSKGLLLTVVLLGGLGLAAFTWFAYWPLRGQGGARRGPRARRRGLRLPDVLGRARAPRLGPDATSSTTPSTPTSTPRRSSSMPRRQTLAQGARRGSPSTEEEINASIPGPLKALEGIFFGTKEFRVEKDLFPGEVVAAGRWCRRRQPDPGAAAVARDPAPDAGLAPREVRLRGGAPRLRPRAGRGPRRRRVEAHGRGLAARRAACAFASRAAA